MPTQKAIGTAKVISENLGKPLGEAMRENGYSKSTSLTPKNLTETDGWTELMEQHLPDKDLAKTHKEGLEATRHIAATQYQDEMDVPDQAVRHKYLETAYKIKGKLKEAESPEPEKGDTYIIDPKIQIIVNKFEEEYRKELEK